MWPFGRKGRPGPEPVPAATRLPRAAAGQPQPPRPGSVFTPTQPRQGVRSLTGRKAQLTRILQALRDDQAHVVLYSERGRGKTSLANAVVERLRQGGTVVSRYSCEADSTFDSIMLGLVRNLPASLMTVPAGDPGEGCVSCLPGRPVRPDDVAALPARLDCRDIVCVVDEFDRVSDAGTAARMADTVKQLSDRRVPLRFMIVGVSENLEQMLLQHPSIQRNIAAVQLPLLLDAEVAALIGTAVAATGLGIAEGVVAQVVLLARGSPHLAQLLGLRLVQAASARGGTELQAGDLDAAVDVLLEEASPQDSGLWSAMTANGRSKELTAALNALATAEHDNWGRFSAVPTDGHGVLVGHHAVPAPIWNVIEEAKVLLPAPAGSGLYRFRNRSMLHHILMLGHKQGGTADRPFRTGGEHGVRLVAVGGSA